MSAHIDADPAPYDRTSPVWRFPAGATTFDTDTGDAYLATTTWAQAQNQQGSQGFAVIEITPDAFTSGNAVNSSMIAQLDILLNLAKSSGKKLALISELSSALGGPSTAWSCKVARAAANRAAALEARERAAQKGGVSIDLQAQDDEREDPKLKQTIIISFSVLGGLGMILSMMVLINYIDSRSRRRSYEELDLHLH